MPKKQSENAKWFYATMQLTNFKNLLIRVDKHCLRCCRTKIKMKYFTNIQEIVVLKSGIIDRDFSCRRKSIVNRGSKVKLIMRRSHVKQEVIAFKTYSHGGPELTPFAVIFIANVVGDFAYRIVQVPVVFRCCSVEEKKQWAFNTNMYVVETLEGSETLLGGAIQPWSAVNNEN